jgi:SSS family solute:Na+ symporter
MSSYIPSILIVVGYVGIMLWIGTWGYRKFSTSTAEEYILGGRAKGWYLAGATLMASQYSAFCFLGAAGLFYSVGLRGYIPFCGMFIGFSLLYWFVFGGRIWKIGRKFMHTTPSDTFKHFYESQAVGYIAAVVLIISLLPYLQTQIMGGAYLLQVATGGYVSYAMGVFIIYAICAYYTLMGGMHSMVYADAFQGTLLTIAMIITAGLLIYVSDGLAGMFDSIASKKLDHLLVSYTGKWNWTFMSTWAIAVGLGWPHHPHMWLRMHVSKSVKSNRLWPVWIAVTFPIVMVSGYLIGSSAFINLPNIAQVDQTLPLIVEKYLPLWFLGLVCAGGLAALISSLAGQLHGLSSVACYDLARIQERKNLSEQGRVSIVRITVALAALIGVVLSFVNIQILAALGAISAALGAMVLPCAVAALIGIPWVTKYGAISSMIGGVFITILFSTYKPLMNPLDIYCGAWGLVTAIVLMVVVSLMTQGSRPSQKIIDQYNAIGW